MNIIKTIEELKQRSLSGVEVSILLDGGFRSSKYIRYFQEDSTFEVINYIDDSEEYLTESEIMHENITNIGKAMRLGALVVV
jgi:hypothetical protein